jgi:hypothetical protein
MLLGALRIVTDSLLCQVVWNLSETVSLFVAASRQALQSQLAATPVLLMEVTRTSSSRATLS